MRSYKKELDSRVENNIFDDIKLEVCRRVERAMFELSQTLSFAVEEENLGAFDDLLACAKIEEIQYYLGQRKHLKEQEALKEKLTKLKDNLNYVLKEIESVGLSNEYNTLLDEVLNPDLK
jgi:hypothetical protein